MDLVLVNFDREAPKAVIRTRSSAIQLTRVGQCTTMCSSRAETFGCGHFMRTALFPVRSTLVNPHRATLSSVVGDHMRNCGAAIFLSFHVI